MRLLLAGLIMCSSVPASAQFAPDVQPNGFIGQNAANSLIVTSRAEEARIVLRQLREICASDRFAARSRCAEGLRLLSEARDEMLARRAAAVQR